MQEISYAYAIIFLTGMLGIWKAVPVGFAFGTSPLMIYILTVSGAVTAVFILYFFGNGIRNYLNRRKKANKGEKKKARALQLFEKYGATGLGLLGCLLMGPNMTMLLGLVLVNSPKKLLFWTIAGIFIWTLALTMLGVLSIDLFHQLVGT